MAGTIFNTFLLVLGVVVVGAVVWWYLKTGDRDRHHEDDARAFFDEHGRWPDQTPEEAEAERRRVAAAVAAARAPMARADDNGAV